MAIRANWGFLVAALSVLVALCALHAPPARAVTAEELVIEAGKARQAGDLDRTVRLLLAAYDIRPAPEVLNNLGRIYEDMGRYGEAFAAYRRVVDDQSAPETLRAMDAGRMSALGPKLGKAWVLPEVAPPGSTILVDGRPPGAPPGAEFAVTHGEHAFEVESPDGKFLWMERISYPVDQRTVLSVDLANPAADMPHVVWKRLDPPVIGLIIDGYDVQSNLAHLERLMLLPGPHRVVFDRGDGGTVTSNFELGVENEITLEDALASAGPRTLATLPPTDDPLTVAKRRASPGGSVWPWLTAGVGAAGVGTGIWLLLQAEEDRKAPATDGAGFVLHTTQAEDEARWNDANRTSLQGSILAGVGGAMLLGGLTWWLSQDDANPVSIAPAPGGLVVGGRF